MAEPVDHHPSPPHSANSQALILNPPTKRTASTTSATPSRKRPHTASNSSSETKDTATTEPQPQEAIELVELPDDVVYQELVDHEFNYGINPVVDDYQMKRFCDQYINVGIGNQLGWDAKIRRLRDKFNNIQSYEMVPFDQMEEFFLWKKMFNRVPPADACSRVS